MCCYVLNWCKEDPSNYAGEYSNYELRCCGHGAGQDCTDSDKTTKQSSLFKRIFRIQEKTSHHDLKKYENLWTGLSTESLVTEGWFSNTQPPW